MHKLLALVVVPMIFSLSVSAADNRMGSIPTEVTYLMATTDYRYIEASQCVANSCVYSRYIQRIESGVVACTVKVKEINEKELVGAAQWASQPKVLYVYTSDKSSGRFRNVFHVGKNCSYRFERTEL